MSPSHTPPDWREAMYYRYWMHRAHHNVYAHYGIRTHGYTLICYYNNALGQPGAIDTPYEMEWELFDLRKDPAEMRSAYANTAYASVVRELTDEMHRLQAEVDDVRHPADVM